LLILFFGKVVSFLQYASRMKWVRQAHGEPLRDGFLISNITLIQNKEAFTSLPHFSRSDYIEKPPMWRPMISGYITCNKRQNQKITHTIMTYGWLTTAVWSDWLPKKKRNLGLRLLNMRSFPLSAPPSVVFELLQGCSFTTIFAYLFNQKSKLYHRLFFCHIIWIWRSLHPEVKEGI
jgi:hypothetical protein